MKPSWNGNLSFGLVNMPVSLYSATRSERIEFHLLHKKDMGRVGYVRRCKVCGRELEADDIIKGYEIAKDEYIEITDEDFEKAEAVIENSHTIQITDFVDQEAIDPKYYDSPYYVAPGKNAAHVYTLLRDALKKSGKVGIATLVFREREHLAAIKSDGRALMLDTMHFSDEINDGDELNLPPANTKVSPKELTMAQKLIDMMSGEFEPEKFKDRYREALMDVIDKKSKGIKVKTKTTRKRTATNVVDIMSKLKASLEGTGKRKVATKRKKTRAA